MADLFKDPTSGDLFLSGAKQPRLTTGTEEAMQRIKARLCRWAGEWRFDTTLGVPYRRDVLLKNPDLSVVRTLLTQEIEGTDGVERVVDMSLVLVPATRGLQISFEARLEDTGEIIGSDIALFPIVSDDDAVLTTDFGETIVL